jgi:phosphatidylserine/phosphatidylglycerophosphate/cardiolipin synthase-like enzyme
MRDLDSVIAKLEGFVQGRNTSVPYANEIEGDLAALFSDRDDEVIGDFVYDLAFYRPEGGE